jgi:hypothetical protein
MSVGYLAAEQSFAPLLDVLTLEKRRCTPHLPKRLAVGIGQCPKAAAIERHVRRRMPKQAFQLRLLAIPQAVGGPPLRLFKLEQQGERSHAARRHRGWPDDVRKGTCKWQCIGRAGLCHTHSMRRIVAA